MGSTEAPSKPRVRRTQAERTAETRRVLLDATLDALVEVGYKATTTTEVAHRAGMSLGALLHHFPTKADLLTAAVAQSFGRRIAEYREVMGQLDPDSDKLDAAVDLLWSLYSRPTFFAWHELWTAARTDPDLAVAVVEIDKQFMAASRLVYTELFPADGAVDSVFADGIGMNIVFTLLTGLATSRTLSGYEPHPPEAVLTAFKTMCRVMLDSTSAARTGSANRSTAEGLS